MAKTTLKSLAEALKMSVSTVSKALNDSHEISTATKKKVQDFARQNNYRPNILAKYLKTGKTNTIGLVLPKMTGAFEAQIIAGMQKAASEKHYQIIIMNTMEDEYQERVALQSMIDKSVDGILFCPIHEDSNTSFIDEINQSIPIVIFDRTTYPLNTHKIGAQNTEGTYAACKHLIETGRKRIAVLCGTKQGITSERLQGYIQAHQDFQLDIIPHYTLYCNISNLTDLQNDIEKHIQKLHQLPSPPDAIIGIADSITTHLLGVLARLGIKVPQTFAIIGFANTDLAESLNPSLSTIRQPTHEIGKIAINKLIEVIQKKSRSQIEWKHIKLPTSIQLRHSTLGK